MNWWKCTFEPLDVLAGADARRLEDGGWGHDGQITPAALSGAIRTLILQRNGYDLRACLENQSGQPVGSSKFGPKEVGLKLGVPRTVNGHDTSGDAAKATFRFAGPFYSSTRDSRWLFVSVPRHLLRYDGKWIPLSPNQDQNMLADKQLDGASILRSQERKTEPHQRLTVLSGIQGSLCELLQNAASIPKGFYSIAAAELQTPERRYGHERADSGVVKEGRLFSRAHLRFEEKASPQGYVVRRAVGGLAGLVAGIDDLIDVNNEYTVRLGGDGRLARVTIMDAGAELAPLVSLKTTVLNSIKVGSVIVFYLATPAIFADGWRPPFGHDQGVELIAAAVDRPNVVSGWDYAKRKPKPQVRAVPAGAVYFYRIVDEDTAKDLVHTYHVSQSVCPVHALSGYGLGVFGLWNPATPKDKEST